MNCVVSVDGVAKISIQFPFRDHRIEPLSFASPTDDYWMRQATFSWKRNVEAERTLWQFRKFSRWEWSRPNNVVSKVRWRILFSVVFHAWLSSRRRSRLQCFMEMLQGWTDCLSRYKLSFREKRKIFTSLEHHTWIKLESRRHGDSERQKNAEGEKWVSNEWPTITTEISLLPSNCFSPATLSMERIPARHSASSTHGALHSMRR